MAGLVVKVLVENEAKVDQGQPVLVLEAMKMEVSIQKHLHIPARLYHRYKKQ